MFWIALSWVLVLGDIGVDGGGPQASAPPSDAGHLEIAIHGLCQQAFRRAPLEEEVRSTRWLLGASPGDSLSDYRQWLSNRALIDRLQEAHRATAGSQPRTTGSWSMVCWLFSKGAGVRW